MDLSIKIMNKKNTVANILKFQTDETSDYWRDKLFDMYTFLDKEKSAKMPWEKRKQYLSSELSLYYDKVKSVLQNKRIESQKIWSENKNAINMIYSKVFGIDCYHILNNMVAEISLNPICPRNLKHNNFTFFYGGDSNNFMKTALHEMIHFVWFYVWQQYFADKPAEYEAPHMKWILSEMVVDTLVKKTEITTLYPEPYKEKPAYKYFYDMKINNAPILSTLEKLKDKSKNIREFMETSYKYCLENEDSIRIQML